MMSSLHITMTSQDLINTCQLMLTVAASLKDHMDWGHWKDPLHMHLVLQYLLFEKHGCH